MLYAANEDTTKRIDICTRLVLRMLDEDDGVKDLAIKTVEDLWFSSPSSGSPHKTKTPPLPQDKDRLLAKVAVIMGASANFKDRHSPLEDMLHKIIADKERGQADVLQSSYVEVCEALIDGLVDASDLPGFVCVLL